MPRYFHQIPEVPEALVQGKELIYLSWFLHNLPFNPAAITQADINEYVSHHSAPGGMRAGFEYYRAFPQDAIQNMNYSKTRLTMPVSFVVVISPVSSSCSSNWSSPRCCSLAHSIRFHLHCYYYKAA